MTGTTGELVSLRRRVSLVDQVSFYLIRELGVFTAFEFDSDFVREGSRPDAAGKALTAQAPPR